MSGRAGTAQRPRCGRGRFAEGGAGAVSWTVAPGYSRGLAQSLAPVLALPFHLQGLTMTGEWLRRDFLEFGPLPGAVPCARLHTRLVLAEWGLAGLTDSVEIVVSELVTNAVAASQRLEWLPAAPVRLWLFSDTTRVLIAVWDADPHLPARSQVDELAESGRGLLLVENLTTEWDAYTTPHHGGKVVRAICATSRSAEGQTGR